MIQALFGISQEMKDILNKTLKKFLLDYHAANHVKTFEKYIMSFIDFLIKNNFCDKYEEKEMVKIINDKFNFPNDKEIIRAFYIISQDFKYFYVFKDLYTDAAISFAKEISTAYGNPAIVEKILFSFAVFIYFSLEKISAVRSFNVKIDEADHFAAYNKLISFSNQPIIIIDYSLNFYFNIAVNKNFRIFKEYDREIFFSTLLKILFENYDDCTISFEKGIILNEKKIKLNFEINRDRNKKLKFVLIKFLHCEQEEIIENPKVKIGMRLLDVYENLDFFFLLIDENRRTILANKFARKYFSIEEDNYFYKDITELVKGNKEIILEFVSKIDSFKSKGTDFKIIKKKDAFIIIHRIVENVKYFVLIKANFFSFAGRTIQFLLKKEDQKTKIQEIHHRVKNNLQIVSSILSLQAQKNISEDTRKILIDARQRIRTIAAIHETLIEAEEFDFEQIESYFNRLKSMILDAYQDQSTAKIDLDIFIDKNLIFNIRKILPLGMLFTEMSTNAVKYAFKGRKEGKIVFELKKLPDDRCKFLFKDDGIGFSEENIRKNSNSLGMELILALSKQLGGDLVIDRSDGLKYEFEFKLND